MTKKEKQSFYFVLGEWMGNFIAGLFYGAGFCLMISIFILIVRFVL